MLKKIKNLYNSLRFLLAAVAVVLDPDKTDSVIKAAMPLADADRFKESLEQYRALPGGATILEQKPIFPRIDLENLLRLPRESFGYQYASHMRANDLDPNFANVDFYDDVTYNFYRYGKVHDFWHVVTGFDTSIPGEIGILAFTYGQSVGPGSIMIIALFFLHVVLFKPRLTMASVDAFVKGLAMGKKSKNLYALDWVEQFPRPFEDVRRDLGTL